MKHIPEIASNGWTTLAVPERDTPITINTLDDVIKVIKKSNALNAIYFRLVIAIDKYIREGNPIPEDYVIQKTQRGRLFLVTKESFSKREEKKNNPSPKYPAGDNET